MNPMTCPKCGSEHVKMRATFDVNEHAPLYFDAESGWLAIKVYGGEVFLDKEAHCGTCKHDWTVPTSVGEALT